MKFLRNTVVPLIFFVLFVLIGLGLMGLPGVHFVTTLDDSRIEHMSDAEIAASVERGAKIVSYIDVYGVPLHGKPFYWSIGWLSVFGIVGFKVGRSWRLREDVS